MKNSYKIVHCGIFNQKENGKFFYGLERKISHGLIQNGHFVYDFSYRDEERNARFLGLKNTGLNKMNQKLINLCVNIDADILFLAKAEKITIETLQEIKRILPKIKVIQWYVDHLIEDDAFFSKLDVVDAFFYANAKKLQSMSITYPNTIFSFFPNISDCAFDRHLNEEKTNDVIYIARDYKEDVRTQFAVLLEEFCKKENITLKVYASLGNAPVFGHAFHRAIAETKIAINFNRDDALNGVNDTKLLGASDRMAQFLGCGICTFSPAIRGFEKLYKADKDIIYFENPSDCFEKIKYYLSNERYEKIAVSGRKRTLELVNAQLVTKFMLEMAFLETSDKRYEWHGYAYKNGAQI